MVPQMNKEIRLKGWAAQEVERLARVTGSSAEEVISFCLLRSLGSSRGSSSSSQKCGKHSRKRVP